MPSLDPSRIIQLIQSLIQIKDNYVGLISRDFARLEKVKYEVGESSGEALEEQISKLFEILSREGENWKSNQETRLKILYIKRTIRYILSTTEGREKSRSWIGRLLKEYEQFWTWMNHDYVPLTNNEAERSLRHGVIWRKTTYGNKSDQGLDFTESILSLIQTLKKQNKPILDYLELVFRAMVQNQPLPQLF